MNAALSQQDPATPVGVWPPAEEGADGAPIPTALVISGAKALESQPVPSQVFIMLKCSSNLDKVC